MAIKPIHTLAILLTFGAGFFAGSTLQFEPKLAPLTTKKKLSMSDAFIQSVYQVPDEELLSVIDFFVTAGGDVNYSTTYGETPLRVSYLRGKMKSFNKLKDLGADPTPLAWPDGFMAIATGNLDAVKQAYPDAVSASNISEKGMSPYLFAVETGNLDKAKYLRPLTSENALLGGEYRLPAIYYAAQNGRIDLIDWLLESKDDVNQVSDFGESALHASVENNQAEATQRLIEAGADVNVRHNLSHQQRLFPPKLPKGIEELEFEKNYPDSIFTPMNHSYDVEIARLLYRAGAPIKELDNEIRVLLTGAADQSEIKVTDQQFNAQKTRIFGKSNPELTNHEFWLEQIRTGKSGYSGAIDIVGERPGYDVPIWSFDRFGMSATELPDGRWIEIAGEHEDYYDSDFCIYNDVIVHDGNGKTNIYSYPKSDFQPTDFHSATLVNDKIYIIGNLGYLGERHAGSTPVYGLDVNTFEITEVETAGVAPGWVSKHVAILGDNNIVISGGEVWADNDFTALQGKWALSLTNFEWTRLE